MKKIYVLIFVLFLMFFLGACSQMDIPATATATQKGYENYCYTVKERAARAKAEKKYHEKEKKRIQKLQAEDVYHYN